ncbi:MAG TPA: circadian clock KaiB family protein [Thermodesulfobacteriota bacterium]|nr:circadian clock KaiB family protein [Thermodesulfobacteriota bacterium]
MRSSTGVRRPRKARASTTSVFRQYIAGKSPNSVRALANFKKICARYLNDDCSTEIIDVLENPLAAFDDQVFVCPMLIRVSPLPRRIIVGDLRDTAKVLDALGIGSTNDGEE